jgi:O-methyltransferase
VLAASRGALVDTTGLLTLHQTARDVARRRVPGDIVECGVFTGGSAAAIATAFHDTPRTVWLFDSFQGMPPASHNDGPFAQSLPAGECRGDPVTVRRNLTRAGVSPERIRLRAGWFTETFTQSLPEQVAFLHIDADWYESVLLSLRTFYPLVVSGGAIVLDDFGWWEGCRRAFYDFTREHRIQPLIDRDGAGQLLWFKGAQHHRHHAPVWRTRGQTWQEFATDDR